MDKYEVFYLRDEEWWQKQLPKIERHANEKPEQTREIIEAAGFTLLYETFVSTKTPELKASCFYLLCLLAKKDISGNLPFHLLKDLYLKCPINYEMKWSISAVMHIAKDIPRDELVWILSLPCPCSDFPNGYAPE